MSIETIQPSAETLESKTQNLRELSKSFEEFVRPIVNKNLKIAFHSEAAPREFKESALEDVAKILDKFAQSVKGSFNVEEGDGKPMSALLDTLAAVKANAENHLSYEVLDASVRELEATMYGIKISSEYLK